jgi:hypothetical protein
MQPTSDEQIRFLVNLQRLLDEGSFVASYKFALLLSLADLCIEEGDDSGAPMPVDTADIAAKFIQYYWRQAVPFPASRESKILKQNTGQQAAIVNAVGDARAAFGDSLPNLMKSSAWRSLVAKVAPVVRKMPLKYLQNVGGDRLDFLYGEVERVIELRSGMAYCFRKFHALISDLVRGGMAPLRAPTESSVAWGNGRSQ